MDKEMDTLANILQERLKAFNADPKKALKLKSVEYNKQWNYGVKCFQTAINEDRLKDNREPLDFMVIRSKLAALKEIDDLRWFYYHCKKYAKTKDKTGKWNTFSKCFFGALRVK